MILPFYLPVSPLEDDSIPATLTASLLQREREGGGKREKGWGGGERGRETEKERGLITIS